MAQKASGIGPAPLQPHHLASHPHYNLALEHTQLTLSAVLPLAGPAAGMLFLPSELHGVRFLTSFRDPVRCHLH